MKIYRVTGGTFMAGAGMALLLTAAQASDRRHNLEPYKAGADAVEVKPMRLIEFKAGEVLGVAELPKGTGAMLEALPEKRYKHGTPEQVLFAAADKILAAAERAAREAAELEERAQAAAAAEQEKGWRAEFEGSVELRAGFANVEAYIKHRRENPAASSSPPSESGTVQAIGRVNALSPAGCSAPRSIHGRG